MSTQGIRKTMKKTGLLIRLLPTAGLVMLLGSCDKTPATRTSIEIGQAIADQVMKSVSFEFERVSQDDRPMGVEFVDFRRIFGGSGISVGYALSSIESQFDSTFSFGVSTSGAIKIWVNGQQVYGWDQPRPMMLHEVAYSMFAFQDSFSVDLMAGDNSILVKSVSDNEDWDFFVRPLDILGVDIDGVEISLAGIAPDRAPSHWLARQPSTSETMASIGEQLAYEYPIETTYLSGNLTSNGTDFGYPWATPPTDDLWQLKVEHRRRPTNDWHYAHGATMLGMLEFADHTSDAGYSDFITRYCNFVVDNRDYFEWQYESRHAFRGSFHRIFRRSMLDDTGAPALPYLELLRRGEHDQYGRLVNEMADYVSHDQVRLGDGTFARPEPVTLTVWADDMFMSVPFLLRMAMMTGDAKYYDDAANQVLQITDLLYVPDVGLAKHCWFGPTSEMSAAFWGRANGWIAWATAEALKYLPEDHSQYAQILSYFQRQMAGLIRYQNEDTGLWHQVLDYPESFQETSATSMFVLAMARGVRNGWLDETYRAVALKGWQGLTTKVDSDGIVHDITRGTGIGYDQQFYFDRERFPHDPRGLGSVMVAALEIDKLISAEGSTNE